MYRFLLLGFAAMLLLGGCAETGTYQIMTSGNYDQAAELYAAELQKNPDDSRLAVLYGYALYKGGHYELAYDALKPLAETPKQAAYANFWAGLAALRMEDSTKFHAAWGKWYKAHPEDYETADVMHGYQAEFMGSLKGRAFMADEIEQKMTEAYSKDCYIRAKRVGIFGDNESYDDAYNFPPPKRLYLP
jgi:tetratricopeptide (TPR) repeat protein